MLNEEEIVRKAAKNLGKDLQDPDFWMKFASVAKKVLSDGRLPKDAFNYSDTDMEKLYSEAYRLFNSGKYMESTNVFRTLVLLDATQNRYTMGLAACAHKMKEYEAAIKLYATASVNDLNDPLPSFHASDCYLEMNDKASALLMLDMAVRRAGKREQYQILKDRALLSIERLKSELMISPSA